MYCSKCGKEIDDQSTYCMYCGNPLGENAVKPAQKKDKASFGFGFLGFLIPIVGLILFVVWHTDCPLKAKSAGLGALFSVITTIIIYILFIVLICVASCRVDYMY